MRTAFSILRPAVPDASGKIAGLQQVASGVVLDLQVVSPEQIVGISGATIFNTFRAFALFAPLPDVRVQDRLENAAEIDPQTQAPAEYRVIGVRRRETHLDILLQRQEGK